VKSSAQILLRLDKKTIENLTAHAHAVKTDRNSYIEQVLEEHLTKVGDDPWTKMKNELKKEILSELKLFKF